MAHVMWKGSLVVTKTPFKLAVSLGSLERFTAYSFTVLMILTALLYIVFWFFCEKAQVFLLYDTSRAPDSW